ncbi:MAG TPA: GNAT family N-acetyltransferase [Tepidisphaeraceae bacterium]|jgi:GNAT superfamily N-acetyltransferase
MLEVREIALPDSANRLRYADDITPLDTATWQRHSPTAHFVAMRAKTCVGRCSIWIQGTPEINGRVVGVIGHYAASDSEAAATLLSHATSRLAESGFSFAVGPMDGTTWRRYRLLTDRGLEPPFFLEPDNPDQYVTHFTSAGFEPLAHYTSALVSDLSNADLRLPSMLARLEEVGVRIRSIDIGRYEEELAAVYELSVTAFAGNFLYTPIGRDEFLSMYMPLRSLLRPELVLLGEHDHRLVGFMFGVPNVLEANRGQPVRTVLAKSLAVHPDYRGIGLGGVLMNLLQQGAHRCGFTRIIHALMHETNASQKISAHNATTIRRYAIYGKGLP